MMFRPDLRGARRALGAALLISSGIAVSAISVAITSAAAAPRAIATTLYNQGRGWLGVATTCVAPAGWTAERLFHTRDLSAALTDLCLYRWTGALGAVPTAAQLAALETTSHATELTEDVPVVYPSATWTGAELGLLTGLRAALRAQVGDVSIAPRLATTRRIRIAVLDTAPDAAHGAILPGASRHGDTLAHLIEDLVCLPGSGPLRACAAEVTSVLAMPWIDRNTYAAGGGYLGTLADLSRAVERAVETWHLDRARDPDTPARLLLNLSLGWEHTTRIADCGDDTTPRIGPPARAVRGILQYAVGQGALVVAAAGNDGGGVHPREGLVCPGRFQELAQDADPQHALLLSVSGVDYHDQPLQTVRPHGTTAIVGLGLGGVAWSAHDPVPPALTGSSVAAAVVSAVSALTWAAQPDWTPDAVVAAVYRGGVDLGNASDACPASFANCTQRRASACGALLATGASLACTPVAPSPRSAPALPVETAALAASYAGVAPSRATEIAMPYDLVPRYLAASVQLAPSVFPTPISETCPTCAVLSIGQGHPTITLPPRAQPLYSPMMIVELANGQRRAMALGEVLEADTRYAFPLPETWVVQTAYLTGFEPSGASLTEQIFVGP